MCLHWNYFCLGHSSKEYIFDYDSQCVGIGIIGMSVLFDFPSLLVTILLIICAATHARSQRPTIFNDENGRSHTGITGFLWKLSRIGERLSLQVSICCIIAAIYVLFIR